MIPLFIPWLLLILLFILIVFIALRKWKIALLLLIIVIALNWWSECFPIHFCSDSKEEGVLKVMSFNVNATKGDISKRAPQLAKIILEYNPDVLFLSELSDKNKTTFDSLLNDALPYSAHTRSYWNCFYSKYPIEGWKRLDNKDNIEHLGVYLCSIFYANDSISFYGCHYASNNYTSDKKYVTPDSISNRHDLITYLTDVEAAYNTRSKESIAVSEIIKDVKYPIILMGDLNDVCGSLAVRILENSGLKDAWWSGGLGYGATIHKPLPFRIDHIMFSDYLELRHIEVIDSKGFSDHDALYAEFAL